jgi:hypothetical protein
VRRLLIGLLGIAALLSAQETRGTISGNVTDAQGAAVPKTAITATEKQTGVKTTTLSESSGAFVLPYLPNGTYEITAEAPGFKKFVRGGVLLSAGEHPVIDIRLDVGAVSESVEVTADAPLLVTANPSVGQVITTAEVEDIPINGRTPMMLDNLALGVISTFEPGPVRPFDNSAPNSVVIGGAPTGRNEILINGAPNAGFSNQMAYSPMQDSVQEVRVNLFDMDASMGHTMGGTINMITKCGTNAMHGAASIYNQTSRLDANSFFNNKNKVPRPPYHQNQYGASGGGPVFIPKVFNGKNKVFWFFGYEGMRDSDPATSPVETGSPENYTSVPTAAERTGDFSALAKLSVNPTVIYDPSTGSQSGTTIARTPFPSNVIPTSQLNKIALNYLKFFPQPNVTGATNGQYNFITNAVDSDGYDNELGRLDVNVSSKYRIAVDGHHNFRAQDKNNFFGNDATGNFLYRINQGAGIDQTYTISPTTYLDVRTTWTRYQEHHFAPADRISPTDLGFPSYIAGTAQWAMMPYITFTSTNVSNGERFGFEPLGYNGDGTNYSDIWQLAGQVIKIHGNHTFKAGTDIRRNQYSAYNFGNPSGTYAFGSTTAANNWTNGPNASSATQFGQDMAAFLLGLPSAGSIDLNAQDTVRTYYTALYIHDDWRVKPNLTLNLGLRWDHDLPEAEWHNRAVNGFDPTATNSISAAAAANYAAAFAAGTYSSIGPLSKRPALSALGGLTFASANSPHIYQTQSGRFDPRIGFAWQPAALGSKTVVRGGVGLMIDPIQISSPVQSGFSQNTAMTVSNNTFLSPATTVSDPFPGNSIQLPTGSSKGASTFLGNAISFYNPHPLNPYSIRWEFSLQRQLPGQMVLEVAYVGNHGVHLPINTQLNYVPRQYEASSLVRDSATISALTGTTKNPMQGLIGSGNLNGSTVAVQQLLLPFPQYPVGTGTSSGVVMTANNAGSSYYESLNVRLQKRYTNGLVLLNNFVYNRMIDRLAYLNDSDSAPEKRPSSDSRPLRNVSLASYQVPIGRGRKVNLQSRWADALIGGWQLAGTLTLQSGSLLSWGNVIYFGGPLNLQPHQPNGLAFNTSLFDTVTSPISQQLANNIRYFDTQFNNLRRDMTKNLDMSMDKNFRFGEHRYLQIRIEGFNLPNRVGFNTPNLSTTTAFNVISNTGFGAITSQANTPRRIESAIKLVW